MALKEWQYCSLQSEGNSLVLSAVSYIVGYFHPFMKHETISQRGLFWGPIYNSAGDRPMTGTNDKSPLST